MSEDLSQFSMMDLFRVEAETQIAVLNEGLLALENGAEASQAESLMRAAHSLKGAARIVNLDLAVRLAHAMEDAFVAVQEGRTTLRSEDTDTLLQTVDFLAHFSKLREEDVEGWTAGKRGDADRLVEQLHSILAPKPAAVVEKMPAAPVSPAPADIPDLSNVSMLELYFSEAGTQTALLTEGLLALEADPQDAELLRSLMRAAHSLKGAARIVGLDPVVRLTHAMEDGFVKAQEGKLVLAPDEVDVLLQATDVLKSMTGVTESALPQWLADSRPVMAGLMDAIARFGTQKSPPAAVREAPPAAAPGPAPPPADIPDLSNVSMLELYFSEAGTQTALLTDGLLGLEANPQDAELLRSLMRAAHSLKGAARIVGLDPIVRLTHAMEDGFVKAQEGKIVLSPDDVDVMLKATDVLKSMSGASESALPQWMAENAPVMAGLIEAIGQLGTGAKKTAPSATPPARAAESAPEKKAVAAPTPAPAPAAPKPGETRPAKPSPPPAEAKTKEAGPPGADRVVRVGAENLNRLMELAAESLVEARRMKPFADSLLKLKKSQGQLESVVWGMREILERDGTSPALANQFHEAEKRVEALRQMIGERLEDFDGFLRRTSILSDRLYQEVIASRMRPFGDGVAGFPRLVRDLARSLGKKVRFTILGKGTEVDRDILEKLEAPLNHILRNGLDHGFETPEQRVALGKPEEGQLKLEARHAAGMLYITVADDGRGIDRERLRAKIISKGLAPNEVAARLTDAELLEFLFLPGFSTAEKVTEVSGRGVGLDVVQTMVQEVGGVVRIASQHGVGTTFHLQLPITRSVMRALLVEISGEPYAFPLPKIDRVSKIPASEVETVEGRMYVKVDGKNIGLLPAFQVFELEERREKKDLIAILVVSDRNHQYGIEVDRFLGERDLVVRPLDPRLGKVADIGATSVLEDGSPILIVDVDDLVRSIDNLLAGGRLAKSWRASEKAAEKMQKRLLVADDSITVRELERQLLKANGYSVDVAVDGMEAWNAVRLGHYDLVISDVDMPRMTGIEFVKHMRADDRFKALPVIIVSYKDREEDRVRGLEAGANYYLTKSSFQDNTFLNAVHDLIGKADE